MSEQQNLKIVRDIFEAFGRGDVPAILEVLDDDVVWIVSGPQDVPYFGERRGKQGAVEFFTLLGSSVEFENFVTEDFAASGDKVFVTGHERARVRASGRGFENHWAMVFTLRDGKVVRFRSYEDSGAVADAFRG